MKLETVLSDDRFEILKYYNEVQSERLGGVAVQRRAPFVSKYSCISRDFEIYRLLTDDNDIMGIAAMAFMSSQFGKVEKNIAIGSDLKVTKNREAVLHWPTFFVDKLRELRENKDIQYFFSAVSSHEREAYNTFIRPRSIRRNLPRYYLQRRFDLVHLHGFLPMSPKPLDTLKFEYGNSQNFEQLTDYIYRKCRNRPLNPFKSPIDVADQIMRWPNHGADKFLMARDYRGRIVGCMGLWPTASQFQFHISNPSDDLVFLHRLLKFTQLLGWGHAISLKLNLNPVFVTHLNFDHPDVFTSLLRTAWKRLNKSEFLSYIHFQGHLATRPPKFALKTRLPYALYLIQLPDDPIPEIWPASENDPAPVFEIPYI